jgi:hypothetical protein
MITETKQLGKKKNWLFASFSKIFKNYFFNSNFLTSELYLLTSFFIK